MTPGPTLEHVTAGTGHVRASPRFEVDAAALEALAPMLPARGGFVPGFEGWTWRGWTVGGALCFDVLAPDGGASLRGFTGRRPGSVASDGGRGPRGRGRGPRFPPAG